MSGYRYNVTQQPDENEGKAIIDGGNATTNYLVVFDNGQAATTIINPVVINFGGAT